jgi:hypothetical protein
MKPETAFNLIVVFVVVMAALGMLKGNHPPVVPDEVMEEVEASIDNPMPISFEEFNPFDWDPDFGLTIDAGDPCSLNIEEITCVDVAAVVKYRRALEAIKTKILKEKVDRLEREVREDKFGFHTC